MRYALIADIHGNLEALQAVLAVIDSQFAGITILCPGDIVGYGPDPSACLDIVQTRGMPCVRGNHEEMVLGLRDFSRCVAAGISAATWTREQLSPAQQAFLRSLPIYRPISEQVSMCHGDVINADTYISDAASAKRALEQLQDVAPQARVLVCGHTHHAAVYTPALGFEVQREAVTMALDLDSGCVLNPGAVGQARDGVPTARFAILDLDQRTVDFFKLGYDHQRTEAKMRKAGLLGGVVLTPPSGVWRRVERARTRWARWRGDKDNRKRGYRPLGVP